MSLESNCIHAYIKHTCIYYICFLEFTFFFIVRKKILFYYLLINCTQKNNDPFNELYSSLYYLKKDIIHMYYLCIIWRLILREKKVN